MKLERERAKTSEEERKMQRSGLDSQFKGKKASNEQCNWISGINNIKPNERILFLFFFCIRKSLLERAMVVCNPASLGLIAYTHRTQFCTRIKNIILYAHTIILPSLKKKSPFRNTLWWIVVPVVAIDFFKNFKAERKKINAWYFTFSPFLLKH